MSTAGQKTMNQIDDVLTALRRVMRAADIHSRHLTKVAGLTAPQLVLLKAIDAAREPTIGVLARKISLSQATVTNIIVRLENRNLLVRQRSEADKRYVYLHLTDAGRKALANAPTPLQESFGKRFMQLKEWEQTMILSSLQRLAELMDAEEIEASPILDPGPLDEN